MKYMIVTTFLIIIFLSCEKKENCFQCSNICYECIQLANSPLCSSDFVDLENFNGTIDFLESEGIKCTKIAPSVSFEECDLEKVSIFENDNYECVAK